MGSEIVTPSYKLEQSFAQDSKVIEICKDKIFQSNIVHLIWEVLMYWYRYGQFDINNCFDSIIFATSLL